MKLKGLKLFQSKASGSRGPLKPEFLVPPIKPSYMKEKMENKRMEKSKAQVSPPASVVSSARFPFSSVGSDDMDFDVRWSNEID